MTGSPAGATAAWAAGRTGPRTVPWSLRPARATASRAMPFMAGPPPQPRYRAGRLTQ